MVFILIHVKKVEILHILKSHYVFGIVHSMNSAKSLVVPRSVVSGSPEKIDLSKAVPTRVSTPSPNDALLLIQRLFDGNASADAPSKIVRYLEKVEEQIRNISLSHLGKPQDETVKKLTSLIDRLCVAAKVEPQKTDKFDTRIRFDICVLNFNLIRLECCLPAIEISKKIKARRFKRSNKGSTPAIQPKDSHDEVIPAHDHSDAGTTTTTIVEVDDWEQLAGPDNESV